MGVAIPGQHNLGFTGAKQIGGSVLLAKNNPNACHLYRDMGGVADGDRQKWTFSCWLKRNTLSAGTRQCIFSHGSTSNGEGFIAFDTDDKIEFGNDGHANFVDTDSVYRDTFGWYHIVWAADSSQPSNDDRWKLYVNGTLVPASDYGSPSITHGGNGYIQRYNDENMDISIGERERGIQSGSDDPYPFDGQMCEVHFVDGQQLAVTEFGFTDPLTGDWRPKPYTYKVGQDVTSTSYAIKSSEQSSDGQIATNAFDREYDDTYADRWRNNGSEDSNIVGNAYIGQDFGSGNDKHIREVRLLQGRASSTGEMITGVKLQYSDNGSSWSDATGSITIDASTYAWQTIKAGPSGDHRYWRLLCSASSNSVWLVTEMTMHEVSSSPAYGTYGYYLPCDGTANVGEDLSGNDLHFRSYNFCGAATIDKATGALPILNTVNGGNHSTVGVRTDADAPGQLVLAIPFTGIATDVSQFINGGTTGTPMTVTGATQNTSFWGNYYASSLYFDGSNDSLAITSDAQVDFGTGDFTIEIWINPTDITHERHLPIIQNGNTASNNYYDWRLYFNNHGYGSSVVWFDAEAGGDNINLESKTAINTYVWTHIAVTRESGTAKLYINGILEDTDSGTSNAIDTDRGTNLEMGFNDLGAAGDTFYKGYYQDLRIYKGVAKYKHNFLPGSAFPHILHDSPSGYPRTTELATTTKGSISVDSVSDHIEVADHADLDMGGSDHCIECWVYPEIASQSNYGCIFSKGAPYQLYYKEDAPDGLSLFVENSDGSGSGYAVYQNNIPANMSKRQWYHVAVTRSSDTWRVFVDGQIKWSGTSDKDVKDTSTALSIGTYNAGSTYELGGFISNLRIVKGSAVYTAAFDPPTEPLTAITNTKLLCCQDYRSATAAAVTPSTITASGGTSVTNFNPFDDNINIVQGEASNYATINDNDPWYNLTIARGALRVYSSSGDRHVKANFRMPEWGKWYWEMKADTVASNGYLATGLYYRTGSLGASAIATAQGRYITASGLKGGAGGSSSSYGGGFDDGDWISIAVDMDAGKIFAAINGRWCEASNPVTGANAMYDDLRTAYSDMAWFPTCNNWQAGNVGFFNFGQRPFRYTPPKGYQPLSTNALGAQKNTANMEPGHPRPDNSFKVLNYSGTGATQRITGLNFQPDLVMLKKYSGGSDRSWQTYDSVRGATWLLHNDANQAQQQQNGGLTAFNRDGFTLSTDDGANGSTSSPKYLAYCWKAGGNKGTWNKDGVAYASAAAAGLTAGSINPSGASVGTKEGFAVIKYEGTGSAATIAHGLGRAPGFIILKNIEEAQNFRVGSNGLPSWDYRLILDQNNEEGDATDFNDTAPTSTVFSVGTDDAVNKDNIDYIAYCWAPIPGIQGFGGYTGNDNDRGIFVNIGFRPELLIIKKLSGADNWCVMHDASVMNDFPTGSNCDHHLRFDTNGMDYTPGGSPPVSIDLLSNGFVHRDNSGQVNDGGRFTWAAWAKSPLNNLYGGQVIAR